MKKSSKARLSTILCGMCCLTMVEMMALCNGINGTILTIYMSLMACAMGLALPFDKFIKTN